MRKLPGLFTLFTAVAMLASVNAAFATPPSGQYSETEYGRAQQVANGKVIAPTGHDVDSSIIAVAPGGDTGWRTGPGSTALAVTKGSLKVEQAEGCTSRDLAAGSALVLAPGKFRLQNTGQQPVELLANFTGLAHGGATPLADGPAEAAPPCAGFGAAAVASGISTSKSFRGDPSAYFRQEPHAGHGSAYGEYQELSIEAGKDAFMGTFTLQPGFSTGWFSHTPHVAILTKGSWAFYEARDGKCEKVEEYHAGDAWVHPVHKHLGAVVGNEPAEITLFGFNMKHGDPAPFFNSQPDHFDFLYAPPSECPTQLR